MKKIILLFLIASVVIVQAQSISFGAEVMPKRNYMDGGGDENYLDNRSPQFIVVDRTNDSLGFFFSKFKATTGVEVPLFIRFKAKKRWFFDFSYSLSKFSVQGNGKTAYVGNFYSKYYPKDVFMDSLAAHGYYSWNYNTDSIYDLFIDKQKDYWTDDFTYTEDIKVRSFGFMIGYRFLPHKAYKPYAQAGMVYRRRVNNYSFQNFSMDNTWVNDIAKVSEGIAKFPENLVYFRFGAGVETYRFRMGINIDVTSSGSAAISKNDGGRIVGRKSERPYGGITSVGLYLGAELFNYDFASKKQLNENLSGTTDIPKVKVKQDKWSYGARLNNSFKYNLSSYYSKQIPLNVISMHSVPNPNFGNTYWDYHVNVVSIKDLSLVDSRPQVEGFFRMNFLKKFLAEAFMGYNVLKVDFATTEVKARMYSDSPPNNYYFDYNTKNTQMYSGVYRQTLGIFNMGTNLMYEAVSKDLLKVRFSLGLSGNFIFRNGVASSDKEHINSTALVSDLNNWINANCPTSMNNFISGDGLYFSEGIINPDMYGTTNDFFNALSVNELKSVVQPQYMQYYTQDQLFKPKEKFKTSYGAFRFGAEAEFNRILIGFIYEKNLGHMDGVLLKKYNNLSLSFGYILKRK